MALKPHHQAENRYWLGEYDAVIAPRDFEIAWGNDARYWCLSKWDDFYCPVELVKVSWLEVSGIVNLSRVGKAYEISFSISLKPDAFGWSDCPIYLMAKIGKKGKYVWRKIDQIHQIQSFPTKIPQEKFEIETPSTLGDDDKRLYFGLYEVWTGKAKGGLLIHSATVSRVDYNH